MSNNKRKRYDWPSHVAKDWYWDQYETTIKQGELDLSDDQTVGIEHLADRHRVDYETQFIDELYGTEQRVWENRHGEALDPGGPTQEMYSGHGFMTNDPMIPSSRIGSMGYDRSGQDPADHVLWGLDLKRVDREGLVVGSVPHYQHMTRGEVNWAAYEKDPKYIQAFSDMVRDNKAPVRGIHAIDFLTDKKKTGKQSYTDKQRVDFIRAANDMIGEQKKEGNPKPEGEYDKDRISTYRDSDGTLQLVMDGQRQQRLSEIYNTRDADGFKKGRLEVGFTYTRKDEDGNDVKVTVGPRGELGKDSGAFDPVAGPPTPVVKPSLKVPNIQVKVPPGLQQWKSLAKQTLKVGGSKK